MKKGTEFGFRAAGEVVKESAKMALTDAALAFGGTFIPLKTIQSAYLSKEIQALQASKNYHEDYEQLAKDLARKIRTIKTDVYGE